MCQNSQDLDLHFKDPVFKEVKNFSQNLSPNFRAKILALSFQLEILTSISELKIDLQINAQSFVQTSKFNLKIELQIWFQNVKSHIKSC